MKVTYKWNGRYHKAKVLDAEAVAKELNAISAKAKITSRAVVAHARAAKSAMHGAFTWNDTEAATKQRLQEASLMLRMLVPVTIEGRACPEGSRAFVFVRPANERDEDDDENGCFIHAVDALTDPEKRDVVLSRALDEIRWFKEKYDHLVELTELIVAIEKTLRKIGPKRPKR
jgi:hypothetical protein